MSQCVFFSLTPPVTTAFILKVLKRDYSPLLPLLSYISSSTTDICLPIATSVSEYCHKELRPEVPWDPKSSAESQETYEARVKSTFDITIQTTEPRLVFLSDSVLCDLSRLIGQPTDNCAILTVSAEKAVSFRGKSDVFPFLSYIKSAADAVTAPAKQVKVATGAPALLSDPKRIAGKQSSELLKALETYNERLVTAIERAQKQSEEHLDSVENVMYKKSQGKLQKFDDFIQAQKPIISGLENLKSTMTSSTQATSLEKRLSALNSTLKKCQNDLKELELTTGTYEDDGLGKMLPLHIMENVQLEGELMVVKVVNLKEGAFGDVQMVVGDEEGDVVLNVLTIKPGLQTLRVRLHRDLYSLSQLSLVFLYNSLPISNALQVSFTDQPPKASSLLSMSTTPPPSLRPGLTSPSHAKSRPTGLIPREDKKEEKPRSPEASYTPHPPQSIDPVPNPAEESPETVQLTEREEGLLRELETVFGDDAQTDIFRMKFLDIMRGPRGDQIELQELGARMIG